MNVPPGLHQDLNSIPPCVSAAQQFLHFAESLRNPPSGFDGIRVEGRDLGDKEEVVYDAALEVLRAYFTGEVSYSPAVATNHHGGTDPRQPIPVHS